MKKILFVTRTCPKCPEAKELLKNENNLTIAYFGEDKDLTELAIDNGIRRAPTLLFIEDNGRKNIYSGIEEIKVYISEGV